MHGRKRLRDRLGAELSIVHLHRMGKAAYLDPYASKPP
jgi:hypothetical protein